jgi:DNA-binding beta-propeller fold protein YncE
MIMMKSLLLSALLAVGAVVPGRLADPEYRLVVVSESGDIITWIRVKDGRLETERVVPIGIMPADIDGPHNVTVAPDNRSYYVSVAHGTPYGSLWRLDAFNDTLIGRAPVEFFPTTISVTPDGDLAFVANSDFYGDRPRVNPLSIVHTPTMTTITNLPVCDMPHGVKVNHAGSSVYVSCMHSDELLELDISTLSIVRRVKTGSGHAMPGGGHDLDAHKPPAPSASASAPAPAGASEHAGHDMSAMPMTGPKGGPDLSKECAPTFVSVSPDDKTLYVACNVGYTMQVWDAATLTLIKELPTGKGAYNVEPSPDGRFVIVTNKKDQSISVFDARTLTEVARIPTTKKIVHGVAYSPDSKLAFITQESIGADPGAVDMIDLGTLRNVATLPVPAQPTGISTWRKP